MKFLITTGFPAFSATEKLPAYVSLYNADHELSMSLISADTVDVWICNGQEVTSELMDLWLDQACHVPKSMLVRDTTMISHLQEYAQGRTVEIAGFPKQKHADIEWEESILEEARMLYSRTRAYGGFKQPELENHERKETVLLVGAGIMNLVTAELLATHGYQVRIVDKGPEPRLCKDWTLLGITNGGGDARMFTRTEADNYNEKGSKIYQNMRSIFRRTVGQGGWSVKSPKDFSPAELAWVDAFERIPAWLAQTFRDNIYEVNMEAGRLWKEWMKTSPHLFEDVGLCKDVYRMYVEPYALEAAIKLNRQLGAITQNISLEEFVSANPGFRSAAESDHLAGAITVEGFTLNIHPFVAKLIDRITALGGGFLWDCEVQGIQRNALGEVSRLESQIGYLEADHYVVSPGSNGEILLRGTASENLVQGVLGVWLQIPNLHPQIQHSIKIHRRGHLVEDINITLAKDKETGKDVLKLGGGYGYVGLDRPSQDCPELNALFNELEEVARIYFPKGYAAAKERGIMYPGGHRQFCVRPFTPTGLGLFEDIPTASGAHLIITGGNNTGGFAQAPAIARAVQRALTGERDRIHMLFHPDRGRLPATMTFQSRIPEPLRNGEVRPPLRLLLLCSDGPQQSYLRYRLDKTFPGYRCILESTEGQVRRLAEQRRFVDAGFMKYHGLRRYILGHDRQRADYFKRLMPQGHASPLPDLTVDSLNCRRVWDAVEEWRPELTIVSGTKIVGRKLTERAGLMINLHTGHLPEYKGNHCIFFALYDGAVDKVSATLHQLTLSLDGGDILDKVSPPILPTDTEETLYTKCVHMAVDRCIEHIEHFSQGEPLGFVPQEATGKTFRHRDRTPEKELWLWWKLTMGGLLHDDKTTARALE